MTDKVKKAIEQLERISNSLASIGETVDYTDVAIQALEQQPCEDCVNREAVAEMLNEMPMKITETWMDFYRKALNSLNKMPSVTPQRPKGKWIQTKDDCDGTNFYDFSFECTECGKEQSFKSNYCPNCGADMRGDNDGI